MLKWLSAVRWVGAGEVGFRLAKRSAFGSWHADCYRDWMEVSMARTDGLPR